MLHCCCSSKFQFIHITSTDISEKCITTILRWGRYKSLLNIIDSPVFIIGEDSKTTGEKGSVGSAALFPLSIPPLLILTALAKTLNFYSKEVRRNTGKEVNPSSSDLLLYRKQRLNKLFLQVKFLNLAWLTSPIPVSIYCYLTSPTPMSPETRPCKRLCLCEPNPSEAVVKEQAERVNQGSNVKDWSDLTEDMLLEILRRIKSLDDFYAFRGVCPNWRSVANLSAKNLSSLNPLVLVQIEVRRDLPNYPTLRDGCSDSDEVSKGDDCSESGQVSEGDDCSQSSQVPEVDDDSESGQVSEDDTGSDSGQVSENDDGLESDYESESEGDLISHGLPSFEVYLYDIIEKRFYKKPLSLSSWRSCNYINFAHGYLAIAFGDGHIQLRHILNNEMKWLPRSPRPFSNDKNIVFSRSPASPGCAFALYEQYSPMLELCFPDHEFQWREYSLVGDSLFMDMIFFNGKLYVLLAQRHYPDTKQLAVLEFTPDITCTLLGMPVNFDQGTFLTSIGGQLLLYCGRFLVWDFGIQRWTEGNNFDRRSIFVSNWQCHACIAPVPDSMVKPNHLYRYDTYNSVHFEIPMEEHVERDELDFVDLLDLTDADSLHVGRPVWIFPGMCS